MHRYISWILSIVFPVLLTAQEHPFLSDFTLIERDGNVLLEWTIVGGSTCNGIQILRATNGLDFVEVGDIPGLCGDVVDPVFYDFLDPSVPELTEHFYRLKLGSDGFSSIKHIQLTMLKESDHRIFPNPTRDHATLLVRADDQARVDIHVHDPHGREMLALLDQRGGRHSVDLHGHPAGIYFYVVLVDGARRVGRFVIQ